MMRFYRPFFYTQDMHYNMNSYGYTKITDIFNTLRPGHLVILGGYADTLHHFES